MTKRKIEAYEGSGNVFADLGLPQSGRTAAEIRHRHRAASPDQGATSLRSKQPSWSGFRRLICLTYCVATTMTIQPSA